MLPQFIIRNAFTCFPRETFEVSLTLPNNLKNIVFFLTRASIIKENSVQGRSKENEDSKEDPKGTTLQHQITALKEISYSEYPLDYFLPWWL